MAASLRAVLAGWCTVAPTADRGLRPGQALIVGPDAVAIAVGKAVSTVLAGWCTVASTADRGRGGWSHAAVSRAGRRHAAVSRAGGIVYKLLAVVSTADQATLKISR